MAFIPASNVAQANIRATHQGEQVENTLYFHRSTAWNVAALEDLASIITTELVSQLKQYQADDCVYREIYLRDLTTANSPVFTYEDIAGQAGVQTNDPLPNNVSFAVSFRTALAGRSFRGRNYIFGLTEASVTGNVVSAAAVADIIAGYNAMKSTAASSGYTWGVLSRFAGGAPRLSGVFTAIQAVVNVDGIVDSQRRRLPGRGI